MKSKLLAAVAAALALGTASSAAAATINVGGTGSFLGAPSFYVANFDFLLPANSTNISLTISNLIVDDRGVLRLNGTDIDAAGIFGFAHHGSFDFNNGIGNVAFFFNDNGPRSTLVTSGLLAGANTLRLLVNDTGNGIFGSLVGGPNGPSGPTGYVFNARVDFDVTATPGVPEPATWALMIMGFGAAGAMLRRRSFARAA